MKLLFMYFFNYFFISFPLYLYILGTFSHTFSLITSLKMRALVSHPYKTKDRILIVCVCVCVCVCVYIYICFSVYVFGQETVG